MELKPPLVLLATRHVQDTYESSRGFLSKLSEIRPNHIAIRPLFGLAEKSRQAKTVVARNAKVAVVRDPRDFLLRLVLGLNLGQKSDNLQDASNHKIRDFTILRDGCCGLRMYMYEDMRR